MGTFLPALRRKAGPATISKMLGDDLAPETKAVLTSYFSALQHGSSHEKTRPWPVERAVAEGFDRVMWVFKSVNTIATDHARLPFRLREGDEGDPLDDHPLYRVLNKQANPLETGQVFRKRLVSQVALSKAGAFVEETKSNGGTLIRVDLLPPGRTRPVPGTGADLIDHWELTLLDGRVRGIDVDKVRWFRDPHPLDPYSGVTPLESAGMSVELDYFSRLYNVMFMRNDGRPGGVLAVDAGSGEGPKGEMDEAEMDRLEAKFGPGVSEAGKLAVISGKLSYADLAARPRDMQYGATTKNAKIEILSAFGVPESVLGYSGDKTFANADAELYTYWTRTMPGYNEIIVSGFDSDSEDELTGYLDVSGVPILERGERDRREEARSEVAAGLRSIFSYATLAGYEDEIESTPHTRALFVPTGKTPLPANAADAAALGLGDPAAPAEGPPADAAAPPGGDAPPLAPGEQNRAEFEPAAALPGGAAPPAGPGAPRAISPPTPPRAPDAGVVDLTGAPPQQKAHLSVVPTHRASLRVERKAAPDDAGRESSADLRATDRFEDTVAAALAALGPRWVERVVSRLESPKARKGTRHWKKGDGFTADTRIGNKALDTQKAVDPDRWAEEAQAQVQLIVEAAAAAAAAGLLKDLSDEAYDDDGVAELVADIVEDVVDMVGRSAAALAEGLAAALNAADQRGESMPEIATEAREYLSRVSSWAATVAITVATGTTAGARDAAAQALWDRERIDVARTWLSRRDAKVRDSHKLVDAEKQTRGLGEPFLVGGVFLRFPGDPLGPPGEVRNCRCYLVHRSRRTGRFVSPRVAL